MIRQRFLILIILSLPGMARAQLPKQKIIDSLIAVISKAPDDSNKVSLLSRVSSSYYPIDYKKGIDYGTLAIKLAEKIGWKKGLEKAYNSLGSNYWARYDFIRAQDYYGASLKIAKEIGDKRYVAINLLDIGVCYDIQGNYLKAIEYYKKGGALFASIKFKDGEMGCYSNIADIYAARLKYSNALEYYNQSLKISKQLQNGKRSGYYYNKIGAVYTLSGNYAKALKYETEASYIFLKQKDYEGLAINLNDLGKAYLLKKSYRQAIFESKAAIKTLENIKDSPTKKMESDFYATIANAYVSWAGNNNSAKHGNEKIRLMQSAAQNYEKSIGIAKSINYRETVATSLKALSDIQLTLGFVGRAFKTYKEYIINRDSLSNSEKDKEYTRHELAFEYTKRKDSLNYIERLQKQELANIKSLSANKLKQQSLYAIVAIVVLLLIASYFIFRSRIQQVKFKVELAKEKSETELRQAGFENKLNDLMLASLKSQMNPHFIFNCLNSIKFYVEKNDTEAASLYITKFSKLIRNILDSARSEKITLGEEIELISLYLEMEHMRLKEKLNYKFDIAKNIDIDFIEIPPLLIQPYVENAIWHGLMPKEKGGTLIVKIFADRNYLIINIADNGIGREMAANLKQKSNLGHTSHGSTLNNERIAMFNAKYKTNTRVIITDLKDNAGEASGTLVTIKLLIQ